MALDLVLRRLAGRGKLLMVTAITSALVLGGLTWAPPASAAVGVPVTYPGHFYDSSVTNPSADKPQSKLWYHDGSWWALMVEAGGTAVTIHELDRATHVWNNTGTIVDDRLNSTGDALWSGKDGRLYVASRVKGTGTGANLEVTAYTYGNGAWSLVPGFPVPLDTKGGSESATIDQDSLGHLWVTYTQGSKLWVAHSTDGGRTTWTPGFVPNVPDAAIASDDISALIAFGSSIGVLWSDQQSGAVRFAIHDDGAADTAWRVEDVPLLAGLADDHINIKQLTGDAQGRIFAAIKTSADEAASPNPDDTLVGVLTRTPGSNGAGSWALAPAGTVAQGYTRPIIAIDAENAELYFLATTGVGGPDIVYKKSPLSSVSFPTGPGQLFIDASYSVNNASGAKDPVDSTTDLVILAASGGQDRYAHAEMELAGGGDGGEPEPEPEPDAAPTVVSTSPGSGATGVAVTANVTATFSEAVTGVSGTSFTLRPTNGTTAVEAAVSYDAATKVATLDPGSSLAGGTSYTATLSGAITDSAGQPLDPNPTTWSFTTASASGDSKEPTVKARTPAAGATGVSLGVNVTATFSEAVTGVDSSTFTLRNKATGQPVPAVVSLTSTTNKYMLNPDKNLAADTRYVASLSSGIRDLAGNALTLTEWEFLTGPAPKVSSRTPAAGATGVSRTADITATFSEPVMNVTTGTFTVRVGTGTAITATVTRNGTTNQWILDPGVTLAANTKYTVTLTGGPSGITDLAGNPLKTVKWTFTTGAT
ncbi:Ig-like domain-containing protein [Blastococcus colisei]|uniref:Ig-like domain-containing protein n=1 Tax=Blastococcus colisei TaxID=1564162 RepID=A0A543PAI5_9ACTN|nr:Ig-like domain-containing protein [Blastococcus colisei]TQN41093.1 Ig-like domain-containing protein [Blastococcus colisei]